MDASNISPEEWFTHFKELAKSLNIEENNDFFNSKLKRLEAHKNNIDLTQLDYPFTIGEVKKAILSSKTSDDLILNEMLRSGLGFILPSVTKLFNIILNSQTFPDLWNIAFQIPLFKGGDVYNTNDYRGISVTSCLGKIYNKTLNTRPQTKIETDRKLLDNQAAYRSNYSTTDQIFILKSLLNKFINVKKGVWHKGLMYKHLSRYGVGGKFYGLISSMYLKIAKSCVKLPNGITQTFDLKRGINQGDTLSPYLYNLYLNDINHIFSSRECNSPTLGETYVHCYYMQMTC